MPFIRAAIERLLLVFLAVARVAFILQGLAFACASLAVFLAAPSDSPPWLRAAMTSSLLLSGTFFVAGLLMIAARRWRVTGTGGVVPAWPWPLLLGLSLVALPAATAIAASGLPALWTLIRVELAPIGPWDGATQAGPHSGLVMLPILAALFVPALVTGAAIFSVAFPLALLPLLAFRSRLLPTLLAMGSVCQAALILSGWIAADAFGRLAAEAVAAMVASGDREVERLGGMLDIATGVLTRTAIALVAPAVIMLVWLAFVRPSGAAAGYFTAGDSAAPNDPS